jgi:hypothetical protein
VPLGDRRAGAPQRRAALVDRGATPVPLGLARAGDRLGGELVGRLVRAADDRIRAAGIAALERRPVERAGACDDVGERLGRAARTASSAASKAASTPGDPAPLV